jgi:hypothetical protein
MNFRTTLILAAVLIGLGLGYYLWRPGPDEAESGIDQTRPVTASAVSRDLLEEKIDDVVKVVCRTGGGEEWVFEKEAGAEAGAQAEWRMTSPLDMKVVPWEVRRFATQLTNLQYDISYKPGEPGSVTAVQAGLEPPKAIVTLTGAGGETASVEIGKKASPSETYVRLAGNDEICVGKADLENLIKSKALEYRDQQLWTFDTKDVKRVEIIDRTDTDKPVTYSFARKNGQWMIESPVSARATSKVDEMIQSMSRLRAIKWHDQGPERLAMYGLEPPALTVRATVEEEVEIEEEVGESESPEGEDEPAEAEEEPAEPKTEIKVRTFELHLSERSPIGEETKVYFQPGDEPVVGALMKTAADKLKPVMSEWREMRLITENIRAATRIELSTPEGQATLVKAGPQWSFESDGGVAEKAVVDELLLAIADLSAVAFVESDGKDLSSFGLDDPQAQARLTIPGVEEAERLAIGAYSDARLKRLIYVRRNEVLSIGKVRVADIEALLRGPREYRDRTVIDFSPGRIERIEMSAENRFADGRTDVTYERQEGTWNMVAPVTASLQKDGMEKLVNAAAKLRAESIAADEGESTAYGLHAPAVTLAVTYKPPVEYRIETPSGDEGDASGAEGEEPKPAKTVEVQPPPETVTLAVTEHDGKVYAKRSDAAPIYELSREFYDMLLDEYRTDKVLTFDDSAVKRLAIRFGSDEHAFLRQDDGWIYQPEPDLPLDDKKVDNLLAQVSDLRTTRYVSHSVADLDAYGLSVPLHQVTAELEDGTRHVLRVSDRACERDPAKRFYAVVEGQPGVFLLTPDTVKRCQVSLAELEGR